VHLYGRLDCASALRALAKGGYARHRVFFADEGAAISGAITGVHRTWLDPAGTDKAAVITPRRAMGDLIGHGVRFGDAEDVLAVAEGVETMLSLRQVAPALPSVAALSAAHLAAFGPADHGATPLHRRGTRPARAARGTPARWTSGGAGDQRAAADLGVGRFQRPPDAARN